MTRFAELKRLETPDALESYLARENESLPKHFERTADCFLKLCENGLEEIIEGQIANAFQGSPSLKDDEIDEIKGLILNIIVYHDVGKINPAFQKKIKYGKDVPDSNHSELGWLIFALLNYEWIDKLPDWAYNPALILTTAIAGHHTFAWGWIPEDKRAGLDVRIDRAVSLMKETGFSGPYQNAAGSLNTFADAFEGWRLRHTNGDEALFTLYKTVYSALILCDAVAASGSGPESFAQTITGEDRRRWRVAFQDYLMKKGFLNDKWRELEDKNPMNIETLNDLRAKIFIEAERNLERGLADGKRIFYLDAPTGSGKTISSINLMLKTLEIKPGLKRAFFVLPFINLIEQSVSVLRDAINAKDENAQDVLEMHSVAEWKSAEETDYARERDDRLFLNAKISVISQVNFLEALGSSRKSANYKVCGLSNSVVIIDEIQSINDTQWTYLQFLLSAFAKSNNCCFILMSATLPRIDRLEDSSAGLFTELIPTPEVYQTHTCFSGRATMVPHLEIKSVDELVRLLENVMREKEPPVKALIVVNTVRRSYELFQALPKEFKTKHGTTSFRKLLLHSQLLPHKKKEAIKIVKKCKEKNIIMVSTQCIEAGVDVDFDFGIRDLSIPDSIEQVAGRINREGKADKAGVLYVVNLQEAGKSDARKIYARGRRWETCDKDLGGIANVIERIRNRDYKFYYDALVNHIRDKNDKYKRSSGISNTKGICETEAARQLRLYDKDITNFRLIDEQAKQSCFIPVEIPIEWFSSAELRLVPSAITENGKLVSGERVWMEYERLKSEKGKKGFTRRAVFATLLSKFCASRYAPEYDMCKPFVNLGPTWEYVYDIELGFKEGDNIF